MIKKKSVLSIILAIFMFIPAMFLLTACGDVPPNSEPISEKGKIYSVQNKQSDVVFYWGDDKDSLMEEVGSEENARTVFSTFTVTFDEEEKVIVSISGLSDGGLFYVINDFNCIEFYDTKEDAENRANRVTDDYYNAEYKFSEDKKVITIKQQVSTKTSIILKLSANV